jgi:hypothetical protein
MKKDLSLDAFRAKSRIISENADMILEALPDMACSLICNGQDKV